jgi:hypothetical protein
MVARGGGGRSLRPVAHPSPARVPGKQRWVNIAAGALLLASAGAVTWVSLPQGGSLRVDLASGEQASGVAVYVDGAKVCSVMPCVLESLEPGAHRVTLTADDREPSPTQSHVVDDGTQTFVTARLGPAKPSVPTETDVFATRAPTPIYQAGGEHAMAEAQVTVELETPGARVFLQRKGERYERRALYGPWPVKLNLEPDIYELVAYRPGYRSDVIPISFETGARQMIVVELERWR